MFRLHALVGSTASDQVGYKVKALTNGNYVVSSRYWDCQAALGCSGTITDVGAVTWGSGTSGVSGVVSASNSLVGSTANDQVGRLATALTNGNYVVFSYMWDCQPALGCAGTVADVGAVTWASGTTGISGVVTASNSLVGSTASDQLGSDGVTALSNGNYVVGSTNWTCQAALGCAGGTVTSVGAVTWGSGSTGVSGAVTTSNSLVGSTVSDVVGVVTALTNGNFTVGASVWGATDEGLAIAVSGASGAAGSL